MLRVAFFFLAILLFSQCKDDDAQRANLATCDEDRFPEVDCELKDLFLAYEEAAAERGIVVDLEELGITGHLVSLTEDGVAGQCSYFPESPNLVQVDLETWNAVSGDLKEYIVFHELGHCERLRGHLEDADGNDLCLSIMASGTQGCSPNYNRSTREAHLDELFDERYYNTWP